MKATWVSVQCIIVLVVCTSQEMCAFQLSKFWGALCSAGARSRCVGQRARSVQSYPRLHCVSPSVCLWECVFGTHPALTRHWFVAVCKYVCAAVPGCCLRLLLAFQLHLRLQSGSARAPASVRTSPSDPCAVPGDLWVVCTRCLSLR